MIVRSQEPDASPDQETEVDQTSDEEGHLGLFCEVSVDDADEHEDSSSEDAKDGHETDDWIIEPGENKSNTGEQKYWSLKLGVVRNTKQSSHHLVHLKDESSSRRSETLTECLHESHEDINNNQENTDASEHIVFSLRTFHFFNKLQLIYVNTTTTST